MKFSLIASTLAFAATINANSGAKKIIGLFQGNASTILATTITKSTLSLIPSGYLSSSWSNGTLTSKVTYTSYTTYCSEPTVVTIYSCDVHLCGPKTVTVSAATTITCDLCVVPETSTVSQKVPTSTSSTQSQGKFTHTSYTTFCPEPTVVTLTSCNNLLCAPKTLSITSATTITCEQCLAPVPTLSSQKKGSASETPRSGTASASTQTVTQLTNAHSNAPAAPKNNAPRVSVTANGGSSVSLGLAGLIAVFAFLL